VKRISVRSKQRKLATLAGVFFRKTGVQKNVHEKEKTGTTCFLVNDN
jgi:hypothetical protein